MEFLACIAQYTINSHRWHNRKNFNVERQLATGPGSPSLLVDCKLVATENSGFMVKKMVVHIFN